MSGNPSSLGHPNMEPHGLLSAITVTLCKMVRPHPLREARDETKKQITIWKNHHGSNNAMVMASQH